MTYSLWAFGGRHSRRSRRTCSGVRMYGTSLPFSSRLSCTTLCGVRCVDVRPGSASQTAAVTAAAGHRRVPPINGRSPGTEENFACDRRKTTDETARVPVDSRTPVVWVLSSSVHPVAAWWFALTLRGSYSHSARFVHMRRSFCCSGQLRSDLRCQSVT